MFVPDPKIIKVDDKVYLTRQYRVADGHFTIGHEFTVKRYVDNRTSGYWLLQDSEGRQITIEKMDGTVTKTVPASYGSYYDR